MTLFFFKRKNKSLLALVFSLPLILYYILDVNFNFFLKKNLPKKQTEEIPSVISKNIEVVKYNDNGEIDYRINSSQITDKSKKVIKVEDGKDQSNKKNLHLMELLDPKIKLFSEKNGITSITASFANLNQEESKLYFFDEILMINKTSSLSIKADKLIVNTSSQEIHASGNIMINSPNFDATAKKMEAQLNNKNIFLSDEVSITINNQNNNGENIIIYADTVEFSKPDYKNNKRYEKFIAQGNPASFFHKKINQLDFTKANAETIEFQLDEKIIIFKNNAYISKLDFEISGENITYHVEESRISTNNETIQPNNRTKTIIKQNLNN